MLYTGVDIEDISRFEGKTKDKDLPFLKRIFTEAELEYCFKNSLPAKHLTARFCAKEAVVKAVSGIYKGSISYSKIEILKHENGAPYVNILHEDLKNYHFSISLSHEKQKAIAFVVVETKDF